jgi:hypothetical protein
MGEKGGIWEELKGKQHCFVWKTAWEEVIWNTKVSMGVEY